MKKILLVLIIALAAFLRLYKLGSYPAFNADEAAIGYNAYSLLETGKDEHGNLWPIHFQSFNDYKPGLYVYMTMPFIKLLGLNEWSVRLPSALAGIISVYLLYLMVIELTRFNNQSQITGRHSLNTDHQSLALLSAFLLAMSPWHLHFSRGGWEVNAATFFILCGVFLFLKAIVSKRLLFFISSASFFVMSLYTYHSARIVTPLLLLVLVVIFFNDIKANIKPLFIAGVIGILLLIPLAIDLGKGEIISRAAGVGLFADVGPIEKTNEQRMEHPGKLSVILHNKVTNYGLAYLKNWGAHYHGLFLFVSGDVIQRNAVPETGQMYLFEIVSIALGLCFIFRNISPITDHRSPIGRFLLLLLFWFAIAPIPAALTFQSPHALRAQNMIIPLTMISALGVAEILNFAASKKRIVKIFILFVFGAMVMWNFARYWHMYYIHMSKEYPFSSQYGLKELAGYIYSQNKDYKNIVVTNKYDQPYILLLFYSKYSPQKFQKEHILTPRDKNGFSTVNSYSNYIFKSIDWDEDKLSYPDSLIIGSNEEIPDETNITKKIYASNNYLYFKVVAN